MEPERWQRIESLLHEVLELPPEDRDAFLERSCGGDEPLLWEVESLLQADRKAASFFGPPLLASARRAAPGEGAGEMTNESSGTMPHPTLGAYRLLGKIGEGGMSTVWLAARADDQYQRRVAIKVLGTAMAGGERIARFLSERQILASLDHPNIARLYDGGTTPDGSPFFVMEYVEGEPIDRYCDRLRLTVNERLELFRAVCSAVSYAHQNLVVHRDLKPDNILVTAEGVPKLLDFGIAKLLNPDLAHHSAAPTVEWLRVMTPGFASPEQVQGKAITTASDVYSLGVLLFKLLTGGLPHRFEGMTPPEMERVLTQKEPPKPSIAIRHASAGAPDPEAVSRARRARPEQLRRQLEGDLDRVVLMALRSEPQRRYSSVERLSSDVGRYLNGLPVSAHPGSLGYRAGKFLRRHRVAAAVATVGAAVILTSVLLLILQSARIADERDKVRSERDKAQQVAAFLEEIFRASDPVAAQGQEISARQILDRGAERIEQLDEAPAVQAALMATIGRIYLERGLLDRAAPLLDRALDLRRQALGPEHVDVAESLRDLGRLVKARGDYTRAEELFRQAVELYRRLSSENGAAIAVSIGDLAGALFDQGDYGGAEDLFHEALRTHALDATQVAKIQSDLGTVLYGKGAYADAERVFREALATLRSNVAGEHPVTAEVLNNLAAARVAQGDDEGAVADFEEALALERKLVGDEHPLVAQYLNNLAMVHYGRARYPQAERLAREALTLRRKLFGDQHEVVAQSLHNLAGVLRDQGDAAAAEPLYRQALVLWRRHLGAEHPNYAATLSNLAVALFDRGEHEEAEALFREALALRRRILRPDHPSTSRTLVGLGQLLTATGRDGEAEPLLREAVEITRRSYPPGHLEIAEAESALGECLTRAGRGGEAEPLLLASYGVLGSKLPPADRRVRLARARLAELYERRGRPRQADRYRDR